MCFNVKLMKTYWNTSAGNHTNHDCRDRYFGADAQIPNQMLVTTEIAGNNCTTMGKNILRTSFNGCMNCGCDRANTSCLALVILTSPTWRETEPRNIAHLEREGGHQPHHSQLTWYSCPAPWGCSVWLVDGGNNAHITSLRKQGPNHKAMQVFF